MFLLAANDVFVDLVSIEVNCPRDSDVQIVNGYVAGWSRQENTANLPGATEMAGVDMRLEAGAYRELHWHKAVCVIRDCSDCHADVLRLERMGPHHEWKCSSCCYGL